MNLFAAETVAGAVAREIRLGEQFPGAFHREGLAYKAAFERAGSDALKLINDRMRDDLCMWRLVRKGRGSSYREVVRLLGIVEGGL